MTAVPSTIGIVASGEDVLNDAVFWVDAGRSSIVTDALSNLGTGGSALNARFGSTTSPDAFDPTYLTHTGTNYIYLSGVAGNSVSCTAPAAAVSFAATPLAGGADTTGAVTGGASFTFSTAGSWTTVRLLNASSAIVAQFTVTAADMTGMTDAYAVTWAVNRSTAGKKTATVTRPILLFGTDDYLEVPDNDLLDFGASDSFTVAWIGRQWTSTAGSFRTMIAKMSSLGTTEGWAVMGSTLDQSTQFRTRDASAQVLAGSLTNTAGSRLALIATRNGNVHTLNKAENGGAVSQATTTSTALDLANATTVRLGANTTAGQVWEGELVAAAVWRRALNANEIATIVARYT